MRLGLAAAAALVVLAGCAHAPAPTTGTTPDTGMHSSMQLEKASIVLTICGDAHVAIQVTQRGSPGAPFDATLGGARDTTTWARLVATDGQGREAFNQTQAVGSAEGPPRWADVPGGDRYTLSWGVPDSSASFDPAQATPDC